MNNGRIDLCNSIFWYFDIIYFFLLCKSLHDGHDGSLSIPSGPTKEQWWTSGRVIDAHGNRRLACVVRSNIWAVVLQTDENMSEYTVHHSLLCIVLHFHRSFMVPMLTMLLFGPSVSTARHQKAKSSTTMSLRCSYGLQIPKISIQSSTCRMCWRNKSDPSCKPHSLHDGRICC